jgi:hypothetical protein
LHFYPATQTALQALQSGRVVASVEEKTVRFTGKDGARGFYKAPQEQAKRIEAE